LVRGSAVRRDETWTGTAGRGRVEAPQVRARDLLLYEELTMGGKRLNRRQVLKHMAGAGAALTLGSRPLQAVTTGKLAIQHIVLVMMENRSFDHFLGWVPGADGLQDGLTYSDSSGVSYSTYPLAPDYPGSSHP